ncbi:type II toxin-antitoxin system RelE/ParE family toxin [Acholeplasma equirhinis]|uniref:type II toxin-antitoxin system RelE/ParE family toxin n=1 Tax=Acholeplasma equirhinis TaxID=555393 RepID=UPI00197AA3CA|nr:type II toxin-antitoxin system RelE/ParE family toxin [Acholeplasma equirhinis]MBN3489955.1 type II toxin-antitoxin system RelE/ParE family toxin [Acholeplasma equirhinis]
MVVGYFPTEQDSDIQNLWEYLSGSGNQKLYNKVNIFIDKLKEHGLLMNQEFKSESFKKLDEDLYELRPDSIRITFTVDKYGRAWILTWFKKTSTKTPPSEIDRANGVKNRVISLVKEGKL